MGLLSRLVGIDRALDRAFAVIERMVPDKDQAAALKSEEVREQLRARRDVLVRGGWWLLAAWASVYIIYDAKVVVVDKVFGLGVTDPLAEPFAEARLALLAAITLSIGAGRLLGRK